MAVNINVPPVPTFNPHTHDLSTKWQKWTRDFETFAVASGVKDDKQKRQLLLHCAGTEVHDIFETLEGTGENYKTAKDKLTAYFTPLKNIPYSRHLFRSEGQKDDESIIQYVTRLRQLAGPCEFGDSKDDFIRDQVIDKCKSKSLRTKLLAEPELKLKKLLEIAQAKEASESRARSFEETDRTFAVSGAKHHKFNNHKNGMKPTGNASPASGDNSCYRCGFRGHTGKDCRISKNVKCYRCGKIGHFKSVCKSKIVQSQEQKHGVKYVSEGKVEAQADDAGTSDEEFGFCVAENKRGMTYATVNIDKEPVKMIVDLMSDM